MKILRLIAFTLMIMLGLSPVLRSEEVREDSIPFQLEIIRSLLSRHPQIMRINSYYKRNFLDLTEAIWRVKKELDLPSLDSGFEQDSEFFYITQTSLDSNPPIRKARVENFKNRIKKSLKNLEKKFGADFFQRKNLEEVFAELSSRKDVQLGKDFFLIAPLMFESNGSSLRHKHWHEVDAFLQNLSLERMLSIYSNSWIHFWKSFSLEKSETLLGAISFVEEQIFRKEIQSIQDSFKHESRLGHQQDGDTHLELSIEKMPRVLGVFRNFGEDCVLRSVPMYALAEEAEVFMVRNSSLDFVQPSAYVFVFNLRIQQHLYPYVLTLNGDLDEKQADLLLDMIGQLKGVDRVLVSHSPYELKLVNSKLVADKMLEGSYELAPDQVVDFGEDWKMIENFSEEYRYKYLDNYYVEDKISKIRWRPVKKLGTRNISMRRKTLKSPYKSSDGIQKISLLDRAMLAAQLHVNSSELTRKFIQKELNLNSEQVNGLLRFAKFDREKLIRSSDFEWMQNKLGFQISDLLRYDEVYAAETLVSLYREKAIREEDFKEVGQKLYKILARKYQDAKRMQIGASQIRDFFYAQIALASELLDRRNALVLDPLFAGSLYYATKNSHNWVMQELHSRNLLDVNMKLWQGANLLHLGVFFGNFELVKFLVAHGANLHAKNLSNWSILRTAVVSSFNESQKYEITKYLLELGAAKFVSRKEFENFSQYYAHADDRLSVMLRDYLKTKYAPNFWGRCSQVFEALRWY